MTTSGRLASGRSAWLGRWNGPDVAGGGAGAGVAASAGVGAGGCSFIWVPTARSSEAGVPIATEKKTTIFSGTDVQYDDGAAARKTGK